MLKGLSLLGAIIIGLSTLLPGQTARVGDYLNFEVANDVLYLPIKTDQYFTSGLKLEFGNRKRSTVGLRESGTVTTDSYWQLQQNIYTPQQIEASYFIEDDRPFASYLVGKHGKSFTDDQLGFGLRWEVTAGILGRYSGGGRMQNAWHSILSYADEVQGWRHEVKPDLILDYELELSQRFTSSPRFNFTTSVTARVGSLYTNLVPKLNFNWLAIRLNERHTLRFDLFANAKFVGYDATLSGGLFNRDERYRGRIRPKRMVTLFGLDGIIEFGGLRLSGGLRHIGTEFNGGVRHAWAWFSVGVQPGR